MLLHHIIILALIQGITEFLPISSSGHLVLFHALTGDGGTNAAWAENMVMDVAVHIGTLISVLFYFRKDVFQMLCGAASIATGKTKEPNSKLLLLVITGSIPVIFAGFLLHFWQPDILRSLQVMAWMSIIFGVVLWHADRAPVTEENISAMSLKSAFLIGLAQVLALIPGVSRSGITMTAGRYLGFSRTESAHYSLLLSMIAISGAGILTGIDLIEDGNMALTIDAAIAAALSCVSSYITIIVMMRWLKTFSFAPFALYRIVLGFILLGLLYGGLIV